MEHNNLEQAIYKNWKQSIYLIGNNRIFEHGVFIFTIFIFVRLFIHFYIHKGFTDHPSNPITLQAVDCTQLILKQTDLQLIVIIVIKLIELSLEIVIILNVPSIMVKNLKKLSKICSNLVPSIHQKSAFCQWSTWAKKITWATLVTRQPR